MSTKANGQVSRRAGARMTDLVPVWLGRWFRRSSVGSEVLGESRPVRVSYVERGFGTALAIGEVADQAQAAAQATPAPVDADGTLHVTAACITLELVGPKGRRSVLAWDPAEVAWDSLVPQG